MSRCSGKRAFGVVVVCGCSLVTVLAGGVAPVCGRVVAGVERRAGVRCAGFPGVVPVGWGAESAWRGFVPVLVGFGVPCPRVGEGAAVWYTGAGLCGGLPGGRGGHRVQVWWGGLSPVAGPLAVWGSPPRSLCRPPGVFQYVDRAGLVWRGAWGPPGRAVGLECRNQGGVVVWCLGVSAHR